MGRSSRSGSTAAARVPAALLAGGEKRKLEVAMLLASDPAVVLLDEPMAGVSAEDVPGLVEVIRSLNRRAARPCSWSSTTSRSSPGSRTGSP